MPPFRTQRIEREFRAVHLFEALYAVVVAEAQCDAISLVRTLPSSEPYAVSLFMSTTAFAPVGLPSMSTSSAETLRSSGVEFSTDAIIVTSPTDMFLSVMSENVSDSPVAVSE